MQTLYFYPFFNTQFFGLEFIKYKVFLFFQFKECYKNCIEECKKDEMKFIDALAEELEEKAKKRSNRQLQVKLNADFTSLERDAGRTIRKCAQDFDVKLEWYLTRKSKRCEGKEFEFLTNTLYQDCPFKWNSQSDRVKFYSQCLERFPLFKMHYVAKKQIKRFERFRYALKKMFKQESDLQTGTGSAMIAGKIVSDHLNDGFTILKGIQKFKYYSVSPFAFPSVCACVHYSLSFSERFK